MAWPPRVGERLPRGADAWFEQSKWSEWILSAWGHGVEREAILRIGSEDVDALWDAIAAEVVEAAVYGVRVAPGGGSCARCVSHSPSAVVPPWRSPSGIWRVGAPRRGP